MSASDSGAPLAVPAPPPPPDRPTPEVSASDAHAVKRLFARGSAWSLANYGTGQIIRLGSNLILWRLLQPEAFGLMAIVNVFMVGLAMFSDVGIGQVIVQSERGDEPTFLNTVWTIQVIRGLLLCVVACLVAIPVARFYGQPQLAGLIPVVSLGAGISAFNSTNMYTASRNVALGRLTIVDLVSQIASLIIMIAWARITHSVWALAIGGVPSNLVRLYLSHRVLPGIRNRFCWDRETVNRVSHFGRWIFFSTILTFLASNSDRLIFGKMVTIAALGAYSIAGVWASFPTYIAGHLVGAVLFPLFSRVNSQRGPVAETFRRLRGIVLVVAGWLCSCLLAGGSTLIRFLYDKRAADAGVILQLLAVGTWFSTLESTNSSVLLALGKPKLMALGHAAKLAAMFVLMPLGYLAFGFPGAVLGLSLTEVVRYAVSAGATIRSGVGNLSKDFILTAAITATTAIGILVGKVYGTMTLPIHNARLNAFIEGALIFLALTACWLVIFAILRRRKPSEAPSLVA